MATIEAAPLWLWTALAAALGALAIWIYWRCQAEEERTLAEGVIADRDRDIAELRAALARATLQAPEPVATAPTLAAPERPVGVTLTRGPRAGVEDAQTLPPAALEAPGARFSAVERDARRYRAWLLRRRLALEGTASPRAMAALAPPSDGEAGRSGRLEGWLSRALEAAKLGRMDDLEAVERAFRGDGGGEATAAFAAAVDVAPVAASFTDAGLDPDAAEALARERARADALDADRARLEEESATLRYRRWFLARRLGDVTAALDAGRDIDVAGLRAALAEEGEAAERPAEAAEASFVGASRAVVRDDAAAVEAARLRRRADALEREVHRLRAETADDSRLSDARSEAASSRFRLWTAEAELRRLRERPIAPVVQPGSIAAIAQPTEAARRDEVDRARLWAARRGAETERAERRRLATAAAEAERRAAAREAELGSAQGDAARMRARFWSLERDAAARRSTEQTETAARAALAWERETALARADAAGRTEADLRRELAAAQTSAIEAQRALEAARREAESAQAEAATARDRAEAAERRASERVAMVVAPAISTPQAPVPRAVAPPRPQPRPVAASEDVSRRRFVRPRLDAARAVAETSAESEARALIGDPTWVAVSSNRPAALSSPPAAGPEDDLSLIDAIDARLAERLRGAGVTRFERLAEADGATLAWIDGRLALGGAPVAERWAPQAAALAALRSDGRLALGSDGRMTAHGATLDAPATPIEPVFEPAPPSPSPTPIVVSTAGAGGADAVAAIEREAAAILDAGRADPTRALPEPDATGPDDLKLIDRIGPKLEDRLRADGVSQFAQLARLDAEGLAALEVRMRLGGRSMREGWLGQAQALARRKESGGLVVGGEGLWTRPRDRDGYDAMIDAALSSSPSAIEVSARRLLEGGGAIDLSARPSGLLNAPAGASPDDLTLIRGVGPQTADRLNDLGVFYFQQLAGLGAEEAAWLDAALAAGGRVVDERWLAQAAALDQRRV